MPVVHCGVDAFTSLRAASGDAAWSAYEASAPEVFAAYHRGWGEPGRGRWATGELVTTPAVLAERADRAEVLVAALEVELAGAGLLAEPHLPTVLMVGSGTSNGWVTPLAGEPTLFLALEMLPDPPYDAVLVAHEAVHLAHARQGAGDWPDDVATTLFSEGLAVVASRALRPGLDDSAYLWFDDQHEDWAPECVQHEPALRALASGHADSADGAVVRSLFTLGGEADWPVRAGYWLGDRAVGALGGELPALTRWSYADVLAWCRGLG